MKYHYLYSSLLVLSFVTSTLAMENEDPKPTSLETLQRIVNIRWDIETYLCNYSMDDSKEDKETLKENLTKFQQTNLEEIRKDLDTLRKIKRLLPSLFENECNLEMICKKLENNLKKSKSSSEANYSLISFTENRHPMFRPKIIETTEIIEKLENNNNSSALITKITLNEQEQYTLLYIPTNSISTSLMNWFIKINIVKNVFRICREKENKTCCLQ